MSMSQLQRRNSKRPNIRLEIITGARLQNLGRHPAGGADEGVPGALAVAGVEHASGDAEVGELDLAVGIEENIASLNIAVNVAVSVEIVESLESLLEDRSDGVLLESLGIGGLHEVEAGALRHEAHDDPEAPVDDEGAEGFDDVGVLDQAHGLRLPPYVLQIAVASIQIQTLDCHLLVVWQVDCAVHGGARSVPYFFQKLVVARVGRVASASHFDLD